MGIIQDRYNKTTAYVKMDKVGEEFNKPRRAKQVDPLSTNLFNAVLREIFKKLDWDEKGIKVNG